MDGFGDPNSTTFACSPPPGYVADNTDCDDGDPNVNPAATEVCNEIDDDCDGNIDEGVQSTFYLDFDNDGFGDAASPIQACSAPSGYVGNDADCNDNNSGVNPNADEICDGIDNDCDGTIDQDPASGPTWYEDADNDGFGNAANTVIACSQPNGYVNNSLDCNDNDSSINPSAPEYCNGIDDNCNNQIDENAVDATTWYQDSDGDGFGNLNVIDVACNQPSGFVNNFEDCDDTDANINPNTTWYVDFDADGFGNPNSAVTTCDPGNGYSLDNTDCNDNIAAINPNATEQCNGVDDNCDGIVDEGCNCSVTNISVSNISACNSQNSMDPLDDTFTADVTVTFTNEPATGSLDLAGDGTASVAVASLSGNTHTFTAVVMSADGTDINLTASFSADPVCNLNNPSAGIAPSSCSGCSISITNIAAVNETCPGFGDGMITLTATGSGQIAYSIDGGITFNLTGVFTNLTPGTYDIKVWILGTPTCSATGVVSILAAPPGSLQTWYKDIDGDLYSDGVNVQSCTQPSGGFSLAINLIATSGDCDDYDPMEYPNQTWYKDTDNDGYSNGTSQTACNRPSGYKTSTELTATSGDCNDGNPGIHPGAPEICNGIDDDCDGEIDENAAGGLTYTGNVFLNTQAAIDAWSGCYSVIDGNLTILGAGVLNLDSLINIELVTGNVTIQSTKIKDMEGLDSLKEVGGGMTVFFNSTLTTPTGLDSLQDVGGNLSIYYNFALWDCCPIHDLINNGGIGGATVIFFNNSTCNSVAAINAACGNNNLVAPPGGNKELAISLSGVSDSFKDIGLFPNPADEFVNILIFGKYHQGKLKVLDATGKMVNTTILQEDTIDEKISIKNWAPGIYFVQVVLDGEIITKKLVVQ